MKWISLDRYFFKDYFNGRGSSSYFSVAHLLETMADKSIVLVDLLGHGGKKKVMNSHLI